MLLPPAPPPPTPPVLDRANDVGLVMTAAADVDPARGEDVDEADNAMSVGWGAKGVFQIDGNNTEDDCGRELLRLDDPVDDTCRVR